MNIMIMTLTKRERELFEVLTSGEGSYPRQFSLQWLTDVFMQRPDVMENTPAQLQENLRQTLIKLGLKLLGAQVATIRRVSPTGRGHTGVYELTKLNDWILSNGNVVATKYLETQQ